MRAVLGGVGGRNILGCKRMEIFKGLSLVRVCNHFKLKCVLLTVENEKACDVLMTSCQ